MRRQHLLACLGAVVAGGMLTAPAAASMFWGSGLIERGLTNKIRLEEFGFSWPPVAGGGVTHDDTLDGRYSFHGQADALADITGLHAHTYNQVIKYSAAGTFDYHGHYLSTAGAVADFDDFEITGPTATVLTPLNFHLVGGQLAEATLFTTESQPYLQSSIQFSVSIISDGVSFGSDGGWHTLLNSNAGAPVNESGLLVGFDGNMSFTTKQMALPVNRPFTVSIVLSVASSVEYNFEEPSFIIEANTDANHTLTFAADRPVFDLPDGYTVNSASAGIVNNRYTAPEPATISLVAAGSLTLLDDRRRRHRCEIERG